MKANKTVIAKYKPSKDMDETRSLTQYDYGQVLAIEGATLPSTYEVYFANSENRGEAYVSFGNSNGAPIPDILLTTGKPIYAWIFLHETQDDGESVFKIKIPVNKRPEGETAEPTPVQQSTIDRLIAQLNVAVADSMENVTHYPRIISGYWYLWDAVENRFINSFIEAQGQKGDMGPISPYPYVRSQVVTSQQYGTGTSTITIDSTVNDENEESWFLHMSTYNPTATISTSVRAISADQVQLDVLNTGGMAQTAALGSVYWLVVHKNS